MNKLTNRQRAFVEHYLLCWQGTEAARRAGYSERTANEQGARLLAKVSVKAEISDRLKELHCGTDELLKRLAEHARGDMGDCLNAYGAPDIDKMRAAGKTHLIKKLKSRTTTVSRSEGEDMEIHEIEIELYDAQAAIDKLLRVAGAYKDRLTIEHSWRETIKQAGGDPDRLLSNVVEGVARQLSAPDTLPLPEQAAALQKAETPDDAPQSSGH